MERSDENVRLIQDVLRFIRDWGDEPGAMEERCWEVNFLIEKLEMRYGVKLPPKGTKRTRKKKE